MAVRYYLSLSELAYSEIYKTFAAKRDNAMRRISECDRLLEVWKDNEKRTERFLVTKARAEIAKAEYDSILRELTVRSDEDWEKLKDGD